MDEQSRLMGLREVAERLGIADQTLRGWLMRGLGPSAFKVGGQWRWRPEVVEGWLRDQEVANSSRVIP